MTVPSRRVPAYRLHKPSGQARVIIHGKHHYLGKYGSPESLGKYHRLVAEHVRDPMSTREAGSGLCPGQNLSIDELIIKRMFRWAVGEELVPVQVHQAVERACTKAGVPKWTPGQLRHNAATRIRRKYGLEAARLVLGHRSASTTEIYAEKDMVEAVQIVKDLG